jgi:hypothetical protein
MASLCFRAPLNGARDCNLRFYCPKILHDGKIRRLFVIIFFIGSIDLHHFVPFPGEPSQTYNYQQHQNWFPKSALSLKQSSVGFPVTMRF